jgi:hypothetical protein
MFVVQSLPRSGTHLLRTALNSHGEVWCYHEVFNPDMQNHHGSEMPPVGMRSVAKVIKHCHAQKRQTGFVAHAFTGLTDHETGPGLDETYRQRAEVKAGAGLWQAMPDATPIITLIRENLLARYASALIASKQKLWIVKIGERMLPPLQVVIEHERMFADFERAESLTTIAMQRFPQALMLRYEDLVDDPDRAFLRIQNHLGVSVRKLTPGTAKTGCPLAESIRNFDEVRGWLAGTRYAAFTEMP